MSQIRTGGCEPDETDDEVAIPAVKLVSPVYIESSRLCLFDS